MFKYALPAHAVPNFVAEASAAVQHHSVSFMGLMLCGLADACAVRGARLHARARSALLPYLPSEQDARMQPGASCAAQVAG